ARGGGAAARLAVRPGGRGAGASGGGVLGLNGAGPAAPPRKAGGGISAPRRAAVAGACLVVAAGLAAGGCSRSQPGTASCLSGLAAGGPPGTASSSPDPAVAAGWTLPGADLQNTRDVASPITSSNVSRLGVAWCVPPAAAPVF